MLKINIDELCEPIEVTVGGKQYTIVDISRETAKRMEDAGKQSQDSTDLDPIANLMAEVLGADEADMATLGVRKLLRLVTEVMGNINGELEAKKSPEAAQTKSRS